MYLSIIIPAYNEEKRVGPTVQSVCTWLAKQPFDGEVIVVDNRSTDATTEVVRGRMHQFPFLHVLHEPRGGKGYAVQAGMLKSHGQVRLFMDADNATPIDHFEKAKPYLDQGYDVVIGSLAVAGAQVLHGGEEPLWRRVLGKLGNLWIQALAVPGIWDTQRGFKVFSAKAAEDIFPRLTTFAFAFDIEVLAIARARGYRIKEIPVQWKNDPDSRVNVWTYPKVLLATVGVFWNRLRRRYHHEYGR